MCARRRPYFLCFAKERRAGRPVPCASLRGALRCSKPAGGSETRAFGPQTSEPLDPPASALLSPAATAGSGNLHFTRRWRNGLRHSCKGCNSVRGVESPPVPMPSCVGESRRARRKKVRRCLSPKGEFLRAPPGPSNAACPQRSEGTTHPARLSLPTFFGEAKKVGAPPGAHPGQQLKCAQ